MFLEINPQARRDLHAITRYITLRNGDAVLARRHAQRLLDRCNDLLKAPGMGTPYEARAGIRKLNEGAYKIFYLVTETKIEILRIWDGRRGSAPLI